MSKEDRLAKVKALLGINGTDQDEVLLFVVQTVEDLVLSYINQDTLPAPLENALIVMCVCLGRANASPALPAGKAPSPTAPDRGSIREEAFSCAHAGQQYNYRD